MNDKDLEAFDKWHNENIANPPTLNELINKAWIGACEYKQKEINELIKQLKHEHDLYKKHLKIYEDENAQLREQDKILGEEIKTYMTIAEKLQAENAKLKHRMELIRLR